MKRASIWLAGSAMLLACDLTTGPTRLGPRFEPTTPSFVLFCTVRDEDGLTVSGAKAEIIDGPYAGLSAVSNANGSLYFAGVSGPLTVRVFKDGYQLYAQFLTVTADFALDVTLSRFRPADDAGDILLGGTITSTVPSGAAPCDPVRWDASAPCRRFRFTAPTSGILALVISWSGGPELDAVIMTPDDNYLAVSAQTGTEVISVSAPVEAGRTYEIRVNSYYGEQTFHLKADLVTAATR